MPVWVAVDIEFAIVRGIFRGDRGLRGGTRLVGNSADDEWRLEFARGIGGGLVFHRHRAGGHGRAPERAFSKQPSARVRAGHLSAIVPPDTARANREVVELHAHAAGS